MVLETAELWDEAGLKEVIMEEIVSECIFAGPWTSVMAIVRGEQQVAFDLGSPSFRLGQQFV